MKHFLLTLPILLLALTGFAATVDAPDFYSEDFTEMVKKSDYPTDGWTTYGTGARPTDFVGEYYFNPDGSGPYYLLVEYEGLTMAIANTEFADGSEADQWLVSPEIDVPYDNAALLFTACAFANKGQNMGVGMNTFKILISTTGDNKEDFTEELLSTGLRGSTSTYLTKKDLVASLNGYKGKKVRLAFVVTGSNVGLTGFANLRMGQYIIRATDYTPEVAELDEPVDIDINIGLKTPVECGYADAVLSINGEVVAEKEFKRTFGSTTSYTLVMQRMLFDDAIILEDDVPVKYSLSVTPRFEGALPTVVTGYISTPGQTYPNNLVIEELTATGCGFCPRGIAALEYFAEAYPGSATTGKAIPIAIHSMMNYNDPMNEGVSEYVKGVEQLNGSGGLPAAVFNRCTQGLDPSNVAEAARQIARTSYNRADILKVTVPEADNIDDFIGKMMEVTFNVRNGYNASSRPLNAAAVLIENDVRGHNAEYRQTNYYADFDEKRALSEHGPEILPYLKPFLKGGELGKDPIMPSEITYQHVARGIWPGIGGQSLASQWVSDQPQEFRLSFTIPSNVLDFKNTAVVILIIDESSNAIVASDIMHYSDFTPSGVGSIAASSGVNAYATPDGVTVEAPQGSAVALHSIDGILLHSTVMPESGILPLCTGTRGLLILTVDGKPFRIIR